MFDRLGISDRRGALSALTALLVLLVPLVVGFNLFKLDQLYQLYQLECTTTFSTKVVPAPNDMHDADHASLHAHLAAGQPCGLERSAVIERKAKKRQLRRGRGLHRHIRAQFGRTEAAKRPRANRRHQRRQEAVVDSCRHMRSRRCSLKA